MKAALSLALAGVALALGGFALTRPEPPPQRAAAQRVRGADLTSPRADDQRGVATLPAMESPSAPVDDAIDRKAEPVRHDRRITADKEPTIEVLAKVLDLSDEQRARTEHVVLEGQFRIREILNTPTLDGTNLMDRYVEIVAYNIANPWTRDDSGWLDWLARVESEKFPGTDVTYGAQVEAVKNEVRATLRRAWSAAQYGLFEEWGVDPTEIRNVPGSPNTALRYRITDRAKALGAD